MTTSEILSVCSLIVFSMSLALSIWNFSYNLRSSRVTQTGRLHEAWWSKEMMETRNVVFGMCRSLAKDDTSADDLVAYYLRPLTTPEPECRAAFARLVGFFCNVEICLASRVIDERLTCRLFAESHYADYLPLIAKVRTAILREASDHKIPHWLQMTIDLEKRFRRHGMKTR
jgi:hypothetical protein